jgi:AraC-like DNA-binding protein
MSETAASTKRFATPPVERAIPIATPEPLSANLYSTAELLRIIECLGLEEAATCELLSECRVSLAFVCTPAKRISLKQFVAGYRIAFGKLGRTLEVDVGQTLHLTTFGIPGLALLSSETLDDAIERMRCWWPLFGLKFAIETVRAGGAMRLVLVDNLPIPQDIRESLVRMEMVKLITIFRDVLGDAFAPERMCISGAACEADNALRAFARSSLEYGAERYMEFSADIPRQRMPQAHEMTNRSAADVCSEMMSKLFLEPSLIRNVKKQLSCFDGGVPSLGDIAQRLCMSERTLRRRLRDLGTSYQRIIEDVRVQMAKGFLRDPSLSTQTIAERLGYAETSNFRIAFKRWTGASPQRFREALPA